MSRPIISPAAAVTVRPVIAPPQQPRHLPRRELEPGLRITEGRVLYSAAWLDRAARALRAADADARSERRPKGGLGG